LVIFAETPRPDLRPEFLNGVFVNSMSDLFHARVPRGFVARVWATMRLIGSAAHLRIRPLRIRPCVPSALDGPAGNARGREGGQVVIEIATPSGTARVHLDSPDDPAFLLAATHGANGGVDTPDLFAVRAVALASGGAVARVMQPFRLAGRRSPGSVAMQDEAWLAVVAALRARFGDIPLVQCGRSNGARVACRTAVKASARGVIALAFPLHPPWRPEQTREDELRQAGVEVVVINGGRDPFGIPGPASATRVYVLPGDDHDLAKHPARVGEIAAEWLRRWITAEHPPARGRR
jgi:uncharacterized protein